ncbi:MAG: hypothetical protein AAFV96_16100, partial [Pseudomonadota bacterium]
MDLDLAIRGGTVVTASDTFEADIGVRDGRIVAIAEALDAAETIDPAGQHQLAGRFDGLGRVQRLGNRYDPPVPNADIGREGVRRGNDG